MVVCVTQQPFSLKFSNVKKGVNFCWIFVGGSLFSQDLLLQINEKSSKFAIIRSHVNFIPHGYFKNSFIKHCSPQLQFANLWVCQPGLLHFIFNKTKRFVWMVSFFLFDVTAYALIQAFLWTL